MTNIEISMKISELSKQFNIEYAELKDIKLRQQRLAKYHKDVDAIYKNSND